MSFDNLKSTLQINSNDFALIFNGAQFPIANSGKIIKKNSILSKI
jgi:hypothetical protein